MQALRLACHLSIRRPASRVPERRPHANATRGLLAPSPSPAFKREEQVVMDSKKRKQEQVDVDNKMIEQEEKPDVRVQETVDSEKIEQEEKPDVGVQEGVDSKKIIEEKPDVGVQETVDSKMSEQEEKPDVGVQETVDSKMSEQEEKPDVGVQETVDSKIIEQEEKPDVGVQETVDSKMIKQEEKPDVGVQETVDSKMSEQEEKPDVGVQETVDSKKIEQEEKPDVGVQETVDSKMIEQEEKPDVGVQETVNSKMIKQEEKLDVGVQETVDSKMIEQEEKHDVEEQVAIDSKEIEQKEVHDSGAEAESGEEEDKEEGFLRVESSVGKRFRLNGSCSLVLHRGDITKWFKDGKSDAIVNAANERMLGGGGVDGAIHRAAGRGLLEACFRVPEVSRGVRCPVGSAVITPGFNLPVSQVIHTVGPVYYSEGDPASVLAKAYKSSVNLAVESGVKYIAFPAISCGVYGYPYNEAAKVSIQALQDSAGQLSEVHFVLFEAETYGAWLAKAAEKLERLTT